MVRDAEATRRRLLEAAHAEFAERGIAGARVDRIAAEAGSNKAQIYHYFGSKDGLFDAVFDRIVARTLAEVPIDPTDLPAYAGSLYDGYVTDPDVQRIATWHRLERGRHLVPAITASFEHKVAALREAQRVGTLSDRWAPEVLLTQILAISAMWATVGPEYDAMLADVGPDARRRAVVDSIAALLA